MPRATPAPKAAQDAPTVVHDPLADLREPEPDDLPGTPEPEGDDQDAEQSSPLVTQEAQDALRALVIGSWHADNVALGFLHKGGRCGCHYLAGVALRAAVPVQPDAEPEPDPEA